jgi:putative endonuclease
MKASPYRRVCATCRRVLDAVTEDGELRWQHVAVDRPADHPAVPVLPTAIAVRGRCDFCSADDPRWYVPARPFLVDGVSASSSDDWAACDECEALIRANRWTALRQRVLQLLAEQHPGTSADDAERLGRSMSHLWRQLRKNITGAPALIPTAQDPSGDDGRVAAVDIDRELAEGRLKRAGLQILDRDWRCPEGQIDIVASDGGVLVICQVEAASGDDFDEPGQVGPDQAAQYRRTALRWLATHGLEWLALRFDGVTVLRRPGGSVSVRHRAGIC